MNLDFGQMLLNAVPDIVKSGVLVAGIGAAILSLAVVLLLFRHVFRYLSEHDLDAFEMAGELWTSYRNVRAADRAERFARSPLGRVLADYESRSGPHRGTENMNFEYVSLGPKEEVSEPSFGGYDSVYGNVDYCHIELED